MRVGITGAEGLLGKHLRAFLRTRKAVEVVCAGRATFATGKALETFVSGCDAIVHFAGMNRGGESEVASTNVRLARELANACTAAGVNPQIIFSSSTHIHRDTAYGASKRACAEILGAWADGADAPFYNLVLPGVFGEGGKPFYNSVVSTFCHQLATGEEPVINQNVPLRLMHAQQVAQIVDKALTSRSSGLVEPEGAHITVQELLNRLRAFDAKYREHVVPDVRSSLDLELFNTYRSYLYPSEYPRQLKLHEDPRGSLFEAVKNLNGGQTFFSTTRPGITRGNHFHLHKIERFLVVRGEAEIRIRSVLSNDVMVFPVSGERPAYIDIPTLHTHSITNTGSAELLTLFWSHEIFDPEAPDTYGEVVST